MKIIVAFLIICKVVSTLSNSAYNRFQDCYFIGAEFRACVIGSTLTLVGEIDPRKKDGTHEIALSISNQSIASIAPNAFNHLRIRELTLELAPRMLNVVPESFYGLSRLRELHFISGRIHLENDIFKFIPLLTSLSIGIEGTIASVAEKLTKLRALRNLRITNSNLKHITYNSFIDFFPVITRFELQNNNITGIDLLTFEKLDYIKYLDFSWNLLTDLRPQIFNGLIRIEYLSITFNKLTAIRKNVFQELSMLKTLNLSNNEIHHINTGSFDGMNIEYLSLEKNRLRIVEARIFNDLKKLKNLNLDYNKISIIENGAFAKLKLSLLTMRNNELTSIGAGTFESFTVEKFDLSFNQICRVDGLEKANVTTLNLYITNVTSGDRCVSTISLQSL